jgi:hypothetical protein
MMMNQVIKKSINLIKQRSLLLPGSLTHHRVHVRKMADEVQKAQAAQAGGDTIFGKILR